MPCQCTPLTESPMAADGRTLEGAVRAASQKGDRSPPTSLPAPVPQPCGCTPTTRCAYASALRELFAMHRLWGHLIRPESQRLRREIVLAYTAHCRTLGELDGRPPGTEVWPVGE